MSAENSKKPPGTSHDYAQRTAFDPAEGVFIAQDRRPGNLSDISLQMLSPMLRALLVIDGTVTKFLEAYALEPVTVMRLDQVFKTLDQEDIWLGLDAGERVISRRVMLVGVESGRLYAYAESRIAPERVPQPMRNGLETELAGLGKILVDSGLETRREGLWYGRERLEVLPEPVAARCDGEFLHRAYRIMADGAALMLITERFPLSTGAVAAFGRAVPGDNGVR